jgi:hypothetical protein
MPIIALSIIKKFGGYALAALVVLAVYLWAHHAVYQSGYKDGEQKVQAAWDADRAKQEAAVVAAVSDAKATSDSNAQHAVTAAVKQGSDQQAVQTVFNRLDQEVKDYATRHSTTPQSADDAQRSNGAVVHSADIGLDADGLRIWNAANAGTDSGIDSAPGQHPQQPAGQVP